jgi:VWFA-related protein
LLLVAAAAKGGFVIMFSRAWFSLFICLSVSAVAQQGTAGTPAEVQPGTALASPLQPKPVWNRQIKLDVVVTDHSGRVVPGLQQSDFTILDNKQPQKMLSFQAESKAATQPNAVAEVFLIVDEVNVGFDRIAYERDEIKKFLQRNGGKLEQPVAMVFFSDTQTEIQSNPSLDGNNLLAAFDQNVNALHTIRRSTGIYGAEDRLQLSLNMLNALAARETPKPGRKLVVWISPGWPILSGPRINLTSKESQSIFNSVVGASTALREARITLYSVDPLGTADSGGLRTTYYQEFLKGVVKPSQVQIGNLALQVLATQSGGLVIYGSNDIVAGVDRCIADANAYYVMTMDAAPVDKPNEYHSIDVKVGTPGLTARTRMGYYAQP